MTSTSTSVIVDFIFVGVSVVELIFV